MFSSRHGVWLLIAGSLGFLGLVAIQYSTPVPTRHPHTVPQKATASTPIESKPQHVRPRQRFTEPSAKVVATQPKPTPSWLTRSAPPHSGSRRLTKTNGESFKGPHTPAVTERNQPVIGTSQPSVYPLNHDMGSGSTIDTVQKPRERNSQDFVPRNVPPASQLPITAAFQTNDSTSTIHPTEKAETVRRIPRPSLAARQTYTPFQPIVEIETETTNATKADPEVGFVDSTVDDDSVAPAALVHPVPQGGPSNASQGTTKYRLADQPKVGDHYKSETPTFDRRASQIPTAEGAFSPDAIDPFQPYDPYLNQQVYEGKQLNATQRPLLELGRPWYQLGQLSPGSSLLGFHNNVNPQFLIFGDYRQAIASNTVNGDNSSQMAYELNTFWHFGLTSTERFVTGVAPLDRRNQNTRYEFDNDQFEFETDFDFDFGYLEGDLGAIAGGFIGETLPFDAPFAIGLTPIFLQNGIWLNDAVEGLFFTIPARASALLDISNMDITFAYIYDEINSAAFDGDENAAKAYAVYSFIEALNGYFEVDYAFLEDRRAINRSYHNISVAYTRRFGRYLSNSTRIIANAGQDNSSEQTADGVLLLSENSLITANPYSIVPYFNFFAGFDTPQSAAGDTELLNTGILFESDGITGFPTLDVSARETAGGAIGLNLLAQDFSQQLILEAAAVFRMDDSQLAGDQYGIGMRYQLPLSNSWIFRTDGMYGFFRNDHDDFGMRMELRKKF